MFNYLAATANGGKGISASYIIIMVAFFVIMYFLMIRPQKKKQKEEQEMRDSIQSGDEVTTIGGIMGRVVTVKEDSLIIETGADRTKLKITRWAIQTNNTAQERSDAEKAAAKAAQEAEKAARDEERARPERQESPKKRTKNKQYRPRSVHISDVSRSFLIKRTGEKYAPTSASDQKGEAQ